MNLAFESIRAKLELDVQRRLVEQVRAVAAASPFVQPVARGGLAMSVKVTCAGELGWVGDGAYHYSRADSRGNPWPPIPAEWTEIANRVIGRELTWDCAIINWYAPGARLGEHVDLSERDRTQPIVTISLGDAASWTVRRFAGAPIHRALLESGDVTVLEDDTRLALHSIERVVDAGLFSPLGVRGRLSMTLRRAG